MRDVVGGTVVLACVLVGPAEAETPKRGYMHTSVGLDVVERERETSDGLRTGRLELGMFRLAGGVELGRRECGTNQRIGLVFEFHLGNDTFNVLGIEYAANWPLGSSVRVGPRIALGLNSEGANGRYAAAGIHLHTRHIHVAVDAVRLTYGVEESRDASQTGFVFSAGVEGRPARIAALVGGGALFAVLAVFDPN